MNELTTMSDVELDKAIEALKERSLALKTESGRRYIVSRMRELIMHLEDLGYTIKIDELALAELWANGLSEEFVRLGPEGMREAVDRWAVEDAAEFRTFPKIPWILDACKAIAGDPRVEKGRRIQAEQERLMELEHQREMEQFKKDHPDLYERAVRRGMELRDAAREEKR